MVIQHPVTTEPTTGGTSKRHCARSRPRHAGDLVLAEPRRRHWRDGGTAPAFPREPRRRPNMRFITNVPVNEFIALLSTHSCLVGNSSAGIKECSYLGTPVVNIGATAAGAPARRATSSTPATTAARCRAARAQIAHGRYAPSHLYYQARREPGNGRRARRRGVVHTEAFL